MPSVTTWTRLEPRCRRDDMRGSLQARVHDPFWLLARQWQLGEFRASDGGTAVIATFRAEAARLSRYRAGGPGATDDAQTYDPSHTPLEVMVERERVRHDGGSDIRLAVEAGLQFVRILSHVGVTATTAAAYLDAWLLAPPPVETAKTLDSGTRRYWNLMARRVIDGTRLYPSLRDARRPTDGGPPRLPEGPNIDDAVEADRVARAADAWLSWYETLFAEPGEAGVAWDAERMEYGFTVAGRTSSNEVVLTVPEYLGGHLDWPHFGVEVGTSLGAPVNAQRITHTAIPAPATFRGMPAARWWEFEDAQIDLGALEAEPEDLPRLLLLEFAALYGNDWFLLPVELPVGTLCRWGSLVVTDSFGHRTLVRPYTEVDTPAAGWRMFNVTADQFFLPPTLPRRLQGPVLEELHFFRDEMANIAWGVERIVESRAGRPLNRTEVYRAEQQQQKDEAHAESYDDQRTLAYRLMSTLPPPNWIPLVPQKFDARSVRLRRGGVLGPEGTTASQVQGRILEPNRPFWVYEEEIPREGVRVTRAYHLARWTDGSTHLWVGRHKRPGRGEGSSGIHFDSIGRG